MEEGCTIRHRKKFVTGFTATTRRTQTYRKVIFPRLHTHDSSPERFQIVERPCHRRIYGRNTNLSWNTRRVPCFQKPMHRRFDSVDPGIVTKTRANENLSRRRKTLFFLIVMRNGNVRRSSYRTCNIGTNTNARSAIGQ